MRAVRNVVVGLIGLLVLVTLGLFIKAASGLNRVRDIPKRAIAVTADSAIVARGRHLATAIMKCTDCHGPDLGGKLVADAGPLGVVYATNLTNGKGGVIGGYDDATIARAIRHGVRADGKPIHIMPAQEYVIASDQDVAAVIAYVRSVAPVDRTLPTSTVKPLGRLLYAAGMFPIIDADAMDHSTPPAPSIEPAPTLEYGRYLANVGGCKGCHGPGFSGGKIPGSPPGWKPAANITPTGLAGWTEADFNQALRTGIRKNRTPIDTLMPWKFTALMDSTEFRALWLYLQTVPPKPYGLR
jgi:mono/diheme cytochrome c family protein